jgi:membrane-anchored protein YejM (alkaline phosphatase superfamily)
MTLEWFDWLDARDREKPFFGFLLYDASNVMNYPDNYGTRFEPAGESELDRKFADYRTAVHFVDSLMSQVLEDLDQRGLADRTVVIFSSDHGEEFDESGTGLAGHGSGYTPYQLKVPMIISVPGRQPAVFSHRSSHYDLAPTVMEEVLGCTNPPSDYASGANLFQARDWNWLLAGSYFNYAVLEPDQVTVTYPNGRFEVRDRDYRIKIKPVIDVDLLESVAEENARFYRK